MPVEILLVLFDKIEHPAQSVRVVGFQAFGDGVPGQGVHSLEEGERGGGAGEGGVGGAKGAGEGGGVGCEEGAARHELGVNLCAPALETQVARMRRMDWKRRSREKERLPVAVSSS